MRMTLFNVFMFGCCFRTLEVILFQIFWWLGFSLYLKYSCVSLSQWVTNQIQNVTKNYKFSINTRFLSNSRQRSKDATVSAATEW